MAVFVYIPSPVEDMERHDGSAEKPYYMNKKLMDLMSKKNKR